MSNLVSLALLILRKVVVLLSKCFGRGITIAVVFLFVAALQMLQYRDFLQLGIQLDIAIVANSDGVIKLFRWYGNHSTRAIATKKEPAIPAVVFSASEPEVGAAPKQINEKSRFFLKKYSNYFMQAATA